MFNKENKVTPTLPQDGATISTNKAEQEDALKEEFMDKELEQLGDPEYEVDGILKFNYFLNIFKISTKYGKT